MSEQNDSQEKELPASEQKLKKSREEGQVPRSRELGAGLILMTAISMLWLFGGNMASISEKFMRKGLTVTREEAFDTNLLAVKWIDLMKDSLVVLAPLFVAVFVVAILGTIAVGGLNWAPKAFAPKMSKLNPIKGLKNIFGMNGFVEFLKSVLKALVFGGIGIWLIVKDIDIFVTAANMSLEQSMSTLISTILFDSLLLAFAYLIIITFDVPYQLWKHHKDLRMSVQEMKKEMKDTEGDPFLKARIRQIQKEMARNRMMAGIPNADAVVINPEHYSVAISYDEQGAGAPKIVAMGVNSIALKIREVAKEHNIPVIEAPPLARALYANGELDKEIPFQLYNAVAKLLAYIYAVAEGLDGAEPVTDSDVPEDLDPANTEKYQALAARKRARNFEPIDVLADA